MYLYNISPRLFACVRTCVFATSFLALAKNSIGVASGEPGETRERIGAAMRRQMNVRQRNFCQIKFRQIKNFAKEKKENFCK